MRRYLALSVVASTLLVAGGDIAPVEPMVEMAVEQDYGEIFGQSRTFYLDRTYSGTVNNNRNSLATGGYIGYKSPVLNGFSAAAAVYGTYGFNIHDQDADVIGAASYDPALYGRDFENYAFIGQAYINYAFGKTNIKIGRQELNTPMAGGDDARMLPNLFEAAILSNTDIEDTTLIAAHVTRETVGTFGNIYGGGILGLSSGYGLGMNEALSGDFVNMGVVALGEGNHTDGVTAAAVIYKGIDGLTLQAWDYYAHDILNAIYIQADYGWNCILNDKIKMNASGQYINESEVGDALAGSVDTNYWSVKLGSSYDALSAYVAYSQTGDSNSDTAGNVITPWGGMPAFTQGMVTRHQFFADTDAWKVAATYNVKEYGVTATVYYTEFDIGLGNFYDPTNAWTASESGWDIQYDVASVKGLNLRARANYPRDFKEGLDWNEYRLIANYNF
ncbi:MAG: OprD family porin [Sulfurovum sp.]|nr:OprD family porin [Sulfurovum sp.]